jgi:hypothetical protein
MVAIAALFGRLEAQAALDRAKQEQESVPADAAKIAKQQTAAAQQAQAQKKLAEAQAQRVQTQPESASSTQNQAQPHPVPAPKTNIQTRSATPTHFTQMPARSSQTAAQKTVANARQRQLDMKVQIAAKYAALKTRAPQNLSPFYTAADGAIPSQSKALNATNIKMVARAMNGKSSQAVVQYRIIPDSKAAAESYHHVTGAPSATTEFVVKAKLDKIMIDLQSGSTLTYQVDLNAAKVELDKAAIGKTRQYSVNLQRQRLDTVKQVFEKTDAVKMADSLALEYERVLAAKADQEAAERLLEQARAQLAAEDARSKAQKNPK